jgi:hypothetical protein
MSDRPDRDLCDNCDHERWHHGEDEGQCGHGWEGDCDCKAFLDEQRDAALAYLIPLFNDEPAG